MRLPEFQPDLLHWILEALCRKITENVAAQMT